MSLFPRRSDTTELCGLTAAFGTAASGVVAGLGCGGGGMNGLTAAFGTAGVAARLGSGGGGSALFADFERSRAAHDREREDAGRRQLEAARMQADRQRQQKEKQAAAIERQRAAERARYEEGVGLDDEEGLAGDEERDDRERGPGTRARLRIAALEGPPKPRPVSREEAPRVGRLLVEERGHAPAEVDDASAEGIVSREGDGAGRGRVHGAVGGDHRTGLFSRLEVESVKGGAVGGDEGGRRGGDGGDTR